MNALEKATNELAAENNARMKEIRMQKETETINGILLYSIVYRIYINEKETSEYKKRIGYAHLTDGKLAIPVGKAAADEMIRMAMASEEYDVGYEDYNYPTGDKGIDGENLEEMKLQSTTFHHIFIKGEHLGSIYGNYKGDRKIRILTKQKKETT